jgi:hypothetical protein
MPYWIIFSLFLVTACAVASVLGYLSAFFGLWAVVLVVVILIPATIEIGRKVLKRDRL